MLQIVYFIWLLKNGWFSPVCSALHETHPVPCTGCGWQRDIRVFTGAFQWKITRNNGNQLLSAGVAWGLWGAK